MKTLWQDVTYSLRSLSKSPGLAAAALLTLAVGIGAAVTVFAFINTVLLGPIPFAEPERAVYLWSTDRQRADARLDVALADFAEWREQSRSFERLAAFQGAAFTLSGDPPERLGGLAVSADFFAVLGAHPRLGRTFLPEEDQSGAQLAVLSHDLWQERFRGDPELPGRTILLDGQPVTVAGVMPADFWFPTQRVKVWRLMDLRPVELERAEGSATVIGLLRRGTHLTDAAAELKALAGRQETSHPETHAGRGARVVPISLQLLDPGDRLAVVLLGLAVLFVLLIACVNVANLLLARGLARQGDLALRVALGAGRGRIARQLLGESLVLALAGGALGLLMAHWGAGALLAVFPRSTPLPESILDGRVLLVALAVSLFATLLSGAIPAVRASKPDPGCVLQEGGAGAGRGPRSRRLFKVLVVSEVALALTLLIVSGLMIRSLVYLHRMDVGFRTHGVLTARVDLPADRYPAESQAALFFDQLLGRVGELAGVDAAAAASHVPFVPGAPSAVLSVEGRPPAPKPHRVLSVVVTSGYFRTLGIPVAAGRSFTAEDSAAGVPVAVVNERLAGQHWPDASPLGKRIRLQETAADEPAGRWVTVVGVVRDVRSVHPAFESRPQVYLPHSQNPVRSMALVVHSPADAARLTRALRADLRSLDPSLALYDVKALEQWLYDLMALPRAFFGMLAAFGVLALLLAATGVFGVTVYAVRQRTHELGVRMALGAARGDVVRLVLQEGMKLVGAGIVIGSVAAFGLSRAISSMLYGVGAGDPITYGTVTAILIGVGLLANYLPARRAAGVPPMEVLRVE